MSTCARGPNQGALPIQVPTKLGLTTAGTEVRACACAGPTPSHPTASAATTTRMYLRFIFLLLYERHGSRSPGKGRDPRPVDWWCSQASLPLHVSGSVATDPGSRTGCLIAHTGGRNGSATRTLPSGEEKGKKSTAGIECRRGWGNGHGLNRDLAESLRTGKRGVSGHLRIEGLRRYAVGSFRPYQRLTRGHQALQRREPLQQRLHHRRPLAHQLLEVVQQQQRRLTMEKRDD